MEKLDRLGWAAGIAFSCYGVRVGIRTNSPEALPILEPYLPPGRRLLKSPVVKELYSLKVARSVPGAKVRQMNLAYSGIARIARDAELLPVLEAVESDLLLRVSELSGRIFVNAGVVAWNDGALLILGDEGHGKTTLVKALVESGAKYFSDRCAVLDGTGRVSPYATPLAIRAKDECAIGDRLSMPSKVTGRLSVPVKGVLISEYRPAAKWQPRQLSQGQAMMALLGHAFPARFRPQKTCETLLAVVKQAEVFKVTRGEAEEVTSKVLELFAGA
jgi:hypothetical protein